MRRRIWVLMGVALLAVATLIASTSCRFYDRFEITDCDELERPMYGKIPYTVCLAARGMEKTQIEFVWDMGDGTILVGLLRDVTHTYTEAGEYEVVCQVTYDDGSQDDDSMRIGAAGDPVAAFTARGIPGGFSTAYLMSQLFGDGLHPETSPESLIIEFNARSSYPNSEARVFRPVELLWEFGDGSVEQESIGVFGWFTADDMLVTHTYAQAGAYDVTLTLTDRLGQTDTVTQTITVGTPGDDDDDVIDQFTLTSSDWEADDEEEDDCLAIYGSVLNNGPEDAGIELTATAYAGTTVVGTISHWVAGVYNITAGVDYQYSFLLCDLSVPIEQVTQVDVVMSDALVY